MLTIYLARHGQTEENLSRIFQGHLPGHLTEEGKRQAIALGKAFGKHSVGCHCQQRPATGGRYGPPCGRQPGFALGKECPVPRSGLGELDGDVDKQCRPFLFPERRRNPRNALRTRRQVHRLSEAALRGQVGAGGCPRADKPEHHCAGSGDSPTA